MLENEDKKEKQETKKDSLMWSEEDYDAMQKMTGFDEESISEDQKKGINVIVFVVFCIFCLIIGLLIGYNINKREPSNTYIITDDSKQVLFYNRLNESNELYLYGLNEKNEENSILELTDASFAYNYFDDNLYVLISKDGLKLYKYTFINGGYERDLVKRFYDKYDSFYFIDNYIILKNDDNIKVFNEKGINVKNFTLDADSIIGYNDTKVIYRKEKTLNIYNLVSDENKIISEKLDSFLLKDMSKLFYLENDKLTYYSITNEIGKELLDISSNSIFVKINDYYLFNDGKSLFILDNGITKLKDFDFNINEIAYLDQNSIIFILEDYDIYNCPFTSNNYFIFDVQAKTISSKEISGCLNTQVINDLVKVK